MREEGAVDPRPRLELPASTPVTAHLSSRVVVRPVDSTCVATWFARLNGIADPSRQTIWPTHWKPTAGAWPSPWSNCAETESWLQSLLPVQR